jgi:hypothetical protein
VLEMEMKALAKERVDRGHCTYKKKKELIEAIVKLALVDWTPGLAILDNKMRRVKFKENRICKSKLVN